MNRIAFQHGDVVPIIVEEIPKGAKRIKIDSGFILERGEGVHTHVFEDIEGIDVYEKGGEIYVHVKKPSVIDHAEHGPQVVQPVKFKKNIERCFDYETMEARRTID